MHDDRSVPLPGAVTVHRPLSPLHPRPPASTEGDEIRVRDLLQVVWRQRWLVLGIALLVIAGTALYTLRQPSLYEGETTLRFSESRPGSGLLRELGPLAGLGALAGGGGSTVATDMLIMQSRSIAEAVVERHALHVQVIEPQLPRSEVLTEVSAPRTVREATYRLRLQADGSYAVTRQSDGGLEETLPAVQIGRPARLGEVELVLNPELQAERPREIRIAVGSFRRTVEDLQDAIDVGRVSVGTQLVRVRFRSTDPLLAAAVPNSVSERFLDYKVDTNRSESRTTIGFLNEQVTTYQQQLTDAEARLRAFREEAQVVSPPHEASEQVRRLAQLQATREELFAEREGLSRLVSQVRPDSPRGAGDSPYRQLAAFPSFLANGAVQNILNSLITLENQRAELLVRRTPQNVDVQGINTRIEELELQLYQTARNYLESLDAQIASLDNTLSRFGFQLEAIPAKEVEFARLMREQKLLEEVYTLLQTRLKEAQIQEASEPDDVRILDPALVPERPVAPRPLLNLILATVLGLGLGLGAAALRGSTDQKVRTRRDVALATAGLPVLATIPRIANGGAWVGRGAAWKRRLIRIPAETGGSERLVTRHDPRAPASEAYRSLRTSLTLGGAARMPQALVLTSAMPGEGKSTSAANLAIAFAQQGTRTLLVDGDLRSGSLHTVFGVPAAPGFSQVLASGLSLGEAVHEVEVGISGAPLHFLSVGTLPSNPAELLASPRMKELLAQMREHYELILFDVPPLNLVSDAALLSASADATLLVVRAGVTDKRALEHATTQLGQLRMPVGGVVLNAITESDVEHYSYAGRGQGWSGHQGGVGEA